ncbi:MAG: tetratricopeptide repeat protein [Gammaproteobacteria bacterium]
MKILKISLFGGFEAQTDASTEPALPTRKSRALLAYLAVISGRTCSREKLADLLWGSFGTARARVSLRQTLARLRRSTAYLPQPCIVAVGDTVRLDTTHVEVDVAEFERSCTNGAPGDLAQAATLYRGDLLEGFNVDESAFEDWLTSERARLRQRAAVAMTTLLDHYVASGQFEQGIAVAMRLLAMDPLQEHVHRTLMQLHWRQGRPQSSMNQYYACRNVLARELGISPDAATESLWRKIQGRAAQGHVATATPSEENTAGHPNDPGPEQLRQAAVLHIELAGLHALREDLIGGELHVLLQHAFDAVTRTVEHNGGHIDHRNGNSVTAVFGVPVAHANDVDRAIHAGLGANAALAALEADDRVCLAHRAGIASGPVLLSQVMSEGQSCGHATGAPVDGAQRLCRIAAPRELLIGDTTRRSATTYLCTERVEPETVNWSDEDGAVWRVRALDPQRRPEHRTPIVGRVAELRQLALALQTCTETGHGATLYVRGEAGIGKTRLVDELSRLAHSSGFVVHKVVVLDFGAGALQDPVHGTLRGLLGIEAGADQATRAAAACAAIDSGDLDSQDLAFVNDLLDLPRTTAARLAYEAIDARARAIGKQAVVSKLVRRLAERQPLLLVVEDVHWAAQDYLGYLADLTVTLRASRAVLIMTARPEGDPLGHDWLGATRASSMFTIDLGALSHTEAEALAGYLSESAGEFARRCVARAGGNPLFLEQLLDGGEHAHDGAVPPSICSLVLARMDRLAEQDRYALLAASVVGQRFCVEVLRYLLENPRYECTALIEHHFVRADGNVLMFSHALVRDAIYDSLLEARRRLLHRRAAAWLAEVDPVLRAEHLDRGRDPGAAQAYLQAALAQNREYHYERALELVRRGFKLALDRRDKFDFVDFEGVLLRNLGFTEACIGAFNQALATAEDDVQQCRAWIGLAAALRVTGRVDEAFEHLASAQTVASSKHLGKALALIHWLRGNLCFQVGRIEQCLGEHEMARHHARRTKSPEHEARALGGLGDAEYARGRMRTAHRYFERCIKLCRRLDYGRIEVAHLGMAAATRLYLNQLRVSLRTTKDAIEAAATVGHRRAEMLARGMAGATLYEMGEYTEARKAYGGALEIARQLEAGHFQSMFQHGVAKCVFHHRDWQQGIALVQRLLEQCQVTGMVFNGAAVLGTLARHTDDPRERERALSQGKELVTAGCVSHGAMHFCRDAIEVNLELSNPLEAEAYATTLESLTCDEPLPWSTFFIARARALAAVIRGDRGSPLTREIERLIREAERTKLRVALPALQLGRETLNGAGSGGYAPCGELEAERD